MTFLHVTKMPTYKNAKKDYECAWPMIVEISRSLI